MSVMNQLVRGGVVGRAHTSHVNHDARDASCSRLMRALLSPLSIGSASAASVINTNSSSKLPLSDGNAVTLRLETGDTISTAHDGFAIQE